jgi:hypothetical protein
MKVIAPRVPPCGIGSVYSSVQWKELPRPPWTLSEHRCVYIGKHLICLVLHDQYPCRLVFDTEKSTWEQFCSCDPSSVVEYEAPAVGMIDGVIYIAGGYALHSTTREVRTYFIACFFFFFFLNARGLSYIR